jgi:hypothetical protein
MGDGNICIAGLTGSDRHVRPVLGGRLPRVLLQRPNGEIRLGSVVDFGVVRPVPSPPEVEDHLFEADSLVLLEQTPDSKLVDRVARLATEGIANTFGPELERDGKTWSFPEGLGSRSLGLLRPQRVGQLKIYDPNKVRLVLDDGTGESRLPVTDVRLFHEDGLTADPAAVAAWNKRLGQTGVVLALGVGRAVDIGGSGRRRHWLQVNNLYLVP